MVAVSRLAVQFRQPAPSGGMVMHVLPGQGDTGVARTARNAGLRVVPLAFPRWPLPDLVARLGPGGWQDGLMLLVGQAETEFHNKLRDQVARDINARSAAITEVELTSPLTSFAARADIIARGRQQLGDTPQVVIEVKTGPGSEFTPNQSYLYALALVGDHVRSGDPRLAEVGLVPNTPLPKMDLMLLCTDGPGKPTRPYLLRAADVNSPATLAAVIASLNAMR